MENVQTVCLSVNIVNRETGFDVSRMANTRLTIIVDYIS